MNNSLTKKQAGTFTRSALCKAVLLACSTLPSIYSAAYAQEQRDGADNANDATIEEILVTGIRSSFTKALDRKKNSDDIIDSIVAEDIGKFPDANVAESLARIPGVSISRAGGEGSTITVRGFGPQFNTVLVDGRRLATDTQGRGFRFDLIGADIIGGADIYKSSPSHIQEGGIGSTVNLKLHKPLDIGEYRAVASARGVYEENSEELAPQFFGLLSNTFADGKIGALASISYQERNASLDQVHGARFLSSNTNEAQVSTLFADGVGNGAGRYLRQQQTRYTRANQERDRLGLTGVLQFELSENVRLTIDALYSQFEVSNDSIHTFQFNERPSFNNAVTDENNILVRYDQIGRPFQAVIVDNRDADIFQVGANLDWNITDSLSASFDVSTSKAKNDNAGDDFFLVVAAPQAVQRYDFTLGTDAPIVRNYEFTLSDTDLNGDGVVNNLDRIVGNEILAPDPNNQFSWFGQREGIGNEDELTELRGDFKWEVDKGPLRSISFGGYYGDQEKSRTNSRTTSGVNRTYLLGQVPLPGNLFSLQNNDGFLGAANGEYPTQFLQYDPEEVIAFLESPATGVLRDELNGLAPGTTAAALGELGYDAVVQPRDGFVIGEEITAFYLNGTFGGTIGDMDLTVNAGVRYTETETTSQGFSEPFTDFVPSAARLDVLTSSRAPAQIISQTEQYDQLLPSLTAKLRVNDNWVVRAGYSESLTRPNLTDLNPSITTTNEIRLSDLTARAGNPALEPFLSENYDLSAEYYFGDTSAFSVGLFKKDISGFIARGNIREAITLPAGNSLALITEDRSNISGNQIFFDVNRPRNLEETTVEGVEISFQHTFTNLPGFLEHVGFNANLTFVDSDDEVTNELIGDRVALPGLGDSQNFVLFYDDGVIEARVAYNNRERFYDSNQGEEPLFQNGLDQVDARIAWNLRDDFQVFFDATNITDSYGSRSGRFSSRFGGLEAPGARYTVGARATF